MEKKMLVYAYYARNTGDDLFLKVLFDRYPDTSWDLLTANKNYKEVFKEYQNVNILHSYREVSLGNRKFNLFFKLNELVFNFKKYDGFLIIGGSIFIQSPAWKMKLEEREYLLSKFKQAGKKAFIMGSNFGPAKDENFTKRYKRLFAGFDDVCFRDSYSYNLFKDLPNVRLAPDVVFNLQVDNQITKEKSIGFSLIDLEKREGLKEYDEDYQRKVTEMIQFYCEKGYAIKLFSFCENEGDLKLSNKVKENVQVQYQSKVTVFNYQGDLAMFLKEFQSCETIIGTRFHSIILALLFRQKFFPILYSNKTFNLISDLGLLESYCRIEEIEKLNVKKLDVAIEKNKLKNNIELIRQADRQFEKLDLFMNEKKLAEAK